MTKSFKTNIKRFIVSYYEQSASQFQLYCSDFKIYFNCNSIHIGLSTGIGNESQYSAMLCCIDNEPNLVTRFGPFSMNCRYFIAVNELSLQHFGVNGDLATLTTTRTTIMVMMKLKCESKNVNANRKKQHTNDDGPRRRANGK